ncbi:glycosyltransferase [Candidatus Beckwithbacteria bacterium CG10_big_fil_rev_8_21_14_0_10_34_10]|uniref:Glycosyltransferase n=1 Tax=Candidatus Beckwithbacteria bacterium CG10_big_fil_rev_8_21_14_0_10_34_10 TaxID=1974495 RepID=A0A2H0WC78_9BACT|nr:MAG: glycosyltransferase [Candidatus Beckwithbacteria bacterium CG10_big_fil_rev_8_21_14_0_10_34_10]
MTKVKKHPTFSIIVPAFNRKETISLCLNALLKQTYFKDDFEIIVVNNNSTDGTDKIVSKFPVRCLRESKQGAYAARNKGIKAAQGKWLVFTDSDCIPDKNWLKGFSQYIEDDKIGCLAGRVIHLKTKTYLDSLIKRSKAVNQKRALSHSFLPFAVTANVAYRREVFQKIGKFDKNLTMSGDMDFSWRMQLETDWKIKYVPQAIVYHRPRQNLKDFLWQIKGYGLGEKTIEKKYQLPLNFFSRLKRTLGYLVLIPLRLLFLPIIKLYNKSESVVIILFDFLYNFFFLWGRYSR